jgi:hypothetical protein
MRLAPVFLGAVVVGLVAGWLGVASRSSMLIVMVMIGLASVAVIFPKMGFVMLVFLTPYTPALTGFMVEAAKTAIGLPLSLFELLAASAWISLCLPALQSGRRVARRFVPTAHVLHLILVIWLMLSAFIGVLRGTDVTVLLRNVLLFSTLFPYAVLMQNGTIRLSERERVYLLWATLGVALSVLFVLAPKVGYEYGGVLVAELRLNRIDRWVNTFVFVYIMCLALGERNLLVSERAVLSVGAMVGVAFSLGRSFWLSALAVIVYVVLTAFRQNKLSLVLVAVTGTGIFSFFALAQQRFSLGISSLQYRFLEWSIILQEASRGLLALLLGRGLGAQVPGDLAVVFPSEYVWWIHNEWLLLLYDAGLVGVLLYGLFLTALMARSRDPNGTRLIGIALLVTSFAAGQVLSAISGPWIALACYSALTTSPQARQGHPRREDSLL